MISILTGDVIKSRQSLSKKWLTLLKDALNQSGVSPKDWEIYRGDSFQLEIKDPAESLLKAIHIKAALKTMKNMDVRMSIGIGKVNYRAAKITESNGEAFINSGERFETLKKEKRTLAIKSPWESFDTEMNMAIRLASIAMDNWSMASAELVKLSIEENKISQQEIGIKLGIAQSTVSERQSRAYYNEIMDLEKVFRNKINILIK